MARKRRVRTALVGSALAVAGGALPATSHAASGLERSATTPTGWWWAAKVTPSTLVNLTNTKHARIVDLEIAQVSPLRLTATLVSNAAGSPHRSGWSWYYGLTDAQVDARIAADHGRIIDIETYVVNGSRRHAVVLVPNTKAWWWYTGLTAAQVVQQAHAHNARIIDWDSYGSGSGRRFSISLLRNTGADARNWHYGFNQTPAQVNALLTSTHNRLVDIEPAASGRFDVLMERSAAGWWWYHGGTLTDHVNAASQNGARISSLIPVGSSYASIELVNVPSETSRINNGQIARRPSGGYSGFYLRRIGGGTTHDINAARPFEPASMLKALYELRALDRVEADPLGLSRGLARSMGWFLGSSRTDDPGTADDERADGCPNTQLPTSSSTSDVIRRMMQRSDNRATNAIRTRFLGSFTAVNLIARSYGLTSTNVRHVIGCGTPPNETTLVDIGTVYRRAADGVTLAPATFTQFRALSNTGSLWDAVIDQEAVKVGLSASKRDAFKAALRTVWKPGGYRVNDKSNSTIGGWVRLPFKTASGVTTNRTYMFGAFAALVPNDTQAGNARSYAQAELLRSTINAALRTWKAAP